MPKQYFVVVLIAVILPIRLAVAATAVSVEGFEKDTNPAKVWVVNMPESDASVQVSSDQAGDGTHSLKLHYHFTGDGQYLGVVVPVKILTNFQTLRFKLHGDSSGCGYGVYLADASGEVHKFRDAATMKADFDGWKEISIATAGPHESWGGDANGKIDLPVTQLTFEISTPGKPAEGDLYFDSIAVDSDGSAIETLGSQISVGSPAYCSDVEGDTAVTVTAPGFKTLTAKCWKQGGRFGADSLVATVNLDDQGKGTFNFPANDYPHGPIDLRISGVEGKLKDNCYLQLYNKGGVSWNEGIPKAAPPGAKGLKLAFEDDFTGPLSIGADAKFTYYDHKPPNGSQDFSTLPFTSNDRPNTPFLQRDSYLRIRASEKANSSGLISSIRGDGSGLKVTAPCYFECRFFAPSAIGTWPAFWLMTDHISANAQGFGCDELDVIEAYGGEGPKSPNVDDLYMVTPHAWAQGDAMVALEKKYYEGMHNPQSMHKVGIPSNWYEAFHIYGCLVTETDTIYYCDDIEVGRHPTFPLSKKMPLFYMVNLATGGGWPVDLSRYNGLADMYVDYVRVYAK